jgi:CRISPR-associated protein Cas2
MHTLFMERKLYIAAYDIRDNSRRRSCLGLTRDLAVDAQESVYECWLSPGDLSRLARDVPAIIDPEEDYYSLFAVSGSGRAWGSKPAILKRHGDLLLFTG